MKRLALILLVVVAAGPVVGSGNASADHDEAIEEIRESLIQINRSINELKSQLQASGDKGDERKEKIRELVSQSFELETKLQKARISRVEAELLLIKQSFQKRINDASGIIDRRVDQLLNAKAEPESPDEDMPVALLSSEGWKAWSKQDFRQSLVSFRKALAKDSEHQGSLNGLGWTYIHLGDFDPAIETFKKLLELNPTHGAAQNGIGQCLLAQKKFDEAERFLLKGTEDTIKAYGEAETVKNGITASWVTLVRMYLMTEQYEKADQWAKRYLKHKPDDSMMLEMQRQIKSAPAEQDSSEE